jgi:signal transduction histidine kinase
VAQTHGIGAVPVAVPLHVARKMGTNPKPMVQHMCDEKTLEQRLQESEDARRALSAELLGSLETERKRIAGELHDDIGQRLTGIKMRIESAVSFIRAGESDRGEELLGGVIPLVQEAIDEVQRISRGIRPSMIDDLGIVATVGWFCREFATARPTIRVELDLCIEEREIPEALKIVFYRVLQEAMNNVAKHANGDVVRVRLSRSAYNLELVVEDNGRGFDVDRLTVGEPGTRGLGLPSMRERVELAGGSLVVRSTGQVGTIVQAILPCSS